MLIIFSGENQEKNFPHNPDQKQCNETLRTCYQPICQCCPISSCHSYWQGGQRATGGWTANLSSTYFTVFIRKLERNQSCLTYFKGKVGIIAVFSSSQIHQVSGKDTSCLLQISLEKCLFKISPVVFSKLDKGSAPQTIFLQQMLTK